MLARSLATLQKKKEETWLALKCVVVCSPKGTFWPFLPSGSSQVGRKAQFLSLDPVVFAVAQDYAMIAKKMSKQSRSEQSDFQYILYRNQFFI